MTEENILKASLLIAERQRLASTRACIEKLKAAPISIGADREHSTHAYSSGYVHAFKIPACLIAGAIKAHEEAINKQIIDLRLCQS